MSADDLWQRVGRSLRDLREAQGWPASGVARHQGPDGKTVKAIEQGRPGNTDSLDSYAQALGISLVDVLRSVIADTPSTPEAAEVARIMDDDLRHDVDGRASLVRIAQALRNAW